MKATEFFEPARLAVLLGLTIGLGIALHTVFFIATFAIAFVAVAQAIIEHAKLTHRHA